MATTAQPTAAAQPGPAKEYSEEQLPEYSPMPWTLSEIRAAIPPHLHVRQTWKGLLYLTRDIILAAITWKLGLLIDPTFKSSDAVKTLTPLGAEVARWGAWSVYWWFQGLIFTGIWVIGHEVSFCHICIISGTQSSIACSVATAHSLLASVFATSSDS